MVRKLKNLVDVMGGPLKDIDLERETAHYLNYYTPSRLGIWIYEGKDKEYRATFYMPIKDFNKKKVNTPEK